MKVGDRVKVSRPVDGWACRPKSFKGYEGVLDFLEEDAASVTFDVSIEGSKSWGFYASELDVIGSANTAEFIQDGPERELVPDRILTEQGRWVHVNRPVDAPVASWAGGGQIVPDLGPSLLDQYAMAAFTGIMASPHTNPDKPARIASMAYSFAKAMMAERERGK